MTYSSVFFDHSDRLNLIPDFDEVYRYMGFRLKDINQNSDDELLAKVFEVVNQFQEIISPQAVYVLYPLKIDGDEVCFENQVIKSKSLSKFLEGCSSVFLFAATIGPKIDLQIQKMQKIDPVKAVIMQAAGAMFIEKYCDLLCKKFGEDAAAENHHTKKRFSPGYGDVNLEVQKIFFKLLDCKKIGLSLMDTLVMAPEKSVTAFVGVGEKNA